MNVSKQNEPVTGTASWHSKQVMTDYPHCKAVQDFFLEIQQVCDFRLETYDLKTGQIVQVTVRRNNRMRKYTGVLFWIHRGHTENWGENWGDTWRYTSGAIHIRQKKNIKRIESCDIENIEILNE